MAYDEVLARRVRSALEATVGSVTERAMFGGLAFMLDGHMLCGIVGNELMLRLGGEAAEAALVRPHVRRMDFTGRPLAGMVFVARDGLRGPALRRWLDLATAFVSTLPPK